MSLLSEAHRVLRRPRYSIRRLRAWKTLRGMQPPYRLNLGCGLVRFDGWTNIDLSRRDTAADIAWNLCDGLPVGDETCELIYSEHVLEHFALSDGLNLLHECRRALTPTGVLRIAMPSLDVLLEKSCNGNWRDQDWLRWPAFKFIKTRAEMLNISFRSWGHLWLYDREELHRRLQEAGFTAIADVVWGHSDTPELCHRETRQDSLLICESRK